MSKKNQTCKPNRGTPCTYYCIKYSDRNKSKLRLKIKQNCYFTCRSGVPCTLKNIKKTPLWISFSMQRW